MVLNVNGSVRLVAISSCINHATTSSLLICLLLLFVEISEKK